MRGIPSLGTQHALPIPDGWASRIFSIRSLDNALSFGLPHASQVSTMQQRTSLLAAALVLVAAGCTNTPSKMAPPPAKTQPFQSAIVNLAPASGTLVSGRLTITAMNDGVHMAGEIGGLGGGATHAIHIHERGDCSAADASSAGGHFNPNGATHGRTGSAMHHIGDMDNLVANAAGVARVDIHLPGVMLGGGGPDDIVNRAVVVHAGADDYTSQPSGNSGARVACGVIQVSL